MFAQKYLSKQGKQPIISEPPKAGTKIVVVIPCYNEPDILQTLHSLASNQIPGFQVEVIVVVNHSENEADFVKQINFKTKKELETWISENNKNNLHFLSLARLNYERNGPGQGWPEKQEWMKPFFDLILWEIQKG